MIPDTRMSVQDKNRRSLRAERKRIKALLDEAISDNDKAEVLVAAMKREKEVMRLVIAALEGSPPAESE